MKKGATPAEENEVNSSDAANRHLWLNKRTLTLGIAMMIGIGIGSGLMMPMITLYIAATFGLSMAITATVTSMRDMFKAPMEFVSGMLSDRFDENRFWWPASLSTPSAFSYQSNQAEWFLFM